MTEEEIRAWEAEEDEADAAVLRRYGGDSVDLRVI
jgi:hypothetical protein